jgi:hypothetical protein
VTGNPGRGRELARRLAPIQTEKGSLRTALVPEQEGLRRAIIEPKQKECLMNSKQRRDSTGSRALVSIAIAAAISAAGLNTASADVSLPPVSVGAGLQTNFYSCQNACIYSPGTIQPGDSSVNGFAVGDIRLYLTGNVTDSIKLTFNTEYTGSGTDTVVVMDAIGRFEFSDAFNIWAGRFLPPSDRANLYGPFYANNWAPYADGVADFYPDVAIGRDNGVAYWGDFGPLKVSFGLFDGESLGKTTAVKDPSKLVVAGRLMWDFWEKEKGYFLNGTYYGDKDIAALGAAFQSLDSKTDYSIDALIEKNFHDVGVFGLESEYQHDNGLNIPAQNHGWYVLGDYLFPQVIGWGKFQLLDRYSQKTLDSTATSLSSETKTNEFDLNYVIKEFNERVGFYYLNQTSNSPTFGPSHREFGIKLQLQI